MKKLLVFVSILTIFTFVFAGCAPKPAVPAAPAAPAEPAAPVTDTTKVVYLDQWRIG